MNAQRYIAACCGVLFLAGLFAAEPPAQIEANKVSVDGQLDDEKARLIIQADLKGLVGATRKAIYGATVHEVIRIANDMIAQEFSIKVDAIEGDLKEIVFALSGTGELREVSGDNLEDWSVRQGTRGTKFLVLRLKKSDQRTTSYTGRARAETPLKEVPQTITLLTMVTEPATLSNGYIRIDTDPALGAEVVNSTGLVPIEPSFLPDNLKSTNQTAGVEPTAFRFHGGNYTLPLRIAAADPEARRVVLGNFRLVGQLSDEQAVFTLTGTARVKNTRGGTLDLLSGGVALTEVSPSTDWRLSFEKGRFVAVFDKPGEFPVQLKFNASVVLTNGWNQIGFRTAAGTLQPVALGGLGPETQFRFAGAARPERVGEEFVSHLPPDGRVDLAWKSARPEEGGALFYAVEMLSQVAISPGLMRQTALLDFKVMQGELGKVEIALMGTGEVTRVQGPAVLAWTVAQVASGPERRLNVQLNQPQKDQFSIQVQMQAPLGAFPQAVDAVSLRPEGATRFGGYFRVVNEGAVRIEVVQASGLSQVSPEQFPQTEASKAALAVQSTQTFAYRYSGGPFALRLQADNILPELAISGLMSYRLGETELAIDAEIELDVREAPLRELMLRVPSGYAVAHLNASGLSDYFLSDAGSETELRLVYATPVSGRQVIQLRLERNQPLGEGIWRLPRVEVLKAKSVRGHIGVSADAGFRLTAGATQGLTEIATAFFPKKMVGIQAAYRLNDPAWSVAFNVERLPQSIQADAFHLFSVGEGIAYGSSIMNYLISGAPIGTFRIELSSEYYNVEFAGKDIRNWQKTEGGYEVQLHTPVSGTYILLATYERPFKAKGDRLTFTGARPVDAQSEQGHTVVVSTYQFQVEPVNVSSSLMPLEPGEVRPEHRLFFDAPILAAFRYTSRPFNLQLALQPLAQGETVSQVVDRASLITRISREGQVVTDARYFVKNKGVPHLRLSLPEDSQLWSVTVNGSAVVPVIDGKTCLVPLPQRADPNTLNDLQVKVASRSKSPARINVAAPLLATAVLLTEWHILPDEGRRLTYQGGTLSPAAGVPDSSAFAGLRRLLTGNDRLSCVLLLALSVALAILAAFIWRSASAEGVHRFTVRHLTGGVLGLLSCAMAVALLVLLANMAAEAHVTPARDLRFVAPVQQADVALAVKVGNVSAQPSILSIAWTLWPALAGVIVWVWSRVTSRGWLAKSGVTLAWILLFWAALRFVDGGVVLFGLAIVFLVAQVAFPAVRRWWRVPRGTQGPAPGASPNDANASVAAALLLGGLWFAPDQALAQAAPPLTAKLPVRADLVSQQIRAEEEYVTGVARIRWQAAKGQVLPILHAPGVLVRADFAADAARLVQLPAAARPAHGLLAETSGTVNVELHYQTRVSVSEGEHGFECPVQPGLVNQVNITVVGQDVDLKSPRAVSITREKTGAATNTVASLVMAPEENPWIGWKPRSRDTRREKAVFYAEFIHLLVPGAGVIEGRHQVSVRPAQGELAELVFTVPEGVTVSDVEAPAMSVWRFDPVEHRLRVVLTPPQSRLTTLLIKSQVAAGPLPFEQTAGMLSLNRAAGQLGLVGVATGTEVQLDDVGAPAVSTINIEDFPSGLLEQLKPQVPGLTLRRAYRYSDPDSRFAIKASSVAPDVRLETQQTLSIGEDRTVLAATLDTEITRAGIFKLSFVLPDGMDVESVSSKVMSHWTDLKTDEGRVITLHLKSRTEGKQNFAVNLIGPGVRSATNWAVPRLVLREADKQRGQLLVVPEQGLRAQLTTRDGVTQMDPLRSGVQQKGVLAFRLLQRDWRLVLDLERIDAWTQVTSLQHLTISDAQVKSDANLQYDIENTGLKSLLVRLPANAESVRFRGDQVSDFVAREAPTNSIWREWEIKLHRRVIGRYLLQVNYHVQLPESVSETTLLGIEALDVNLQRGFVTLQTAGRLQLRIDSPPPALQPAEWQSIPRALQQDIAAAAANYTYRLVEAAFSLPVRLERHEAARLLPARVLSVTLTSALSDDGVMLTQARLQLVPGDKRLLRVTLPDQAKFWFAFVNQNSVWPWRETNQVLLPLQQHSRIGETTTVEFFYTSRTGRGKPRSLDLQLLGPRFDLPLENIAWRVFLSEKWRLTHWKGSLQLQSDKPALTPATLDLNAYIQGEATAQKQKTREAEQFLSYANRLLEKGDPEQARRNFQAAYGLSQHDTAFNEDARVQLHNLKMQQALVGLNVGQAKVAGEAGGLAVIPRALREGQTVYTQQEAKQLIERNTADDNAVQMRLAERIIQQQDAALASPAAIRATVPDQGRLLTFTRPLQVDKWADLNIQIEASAVRPAPLFWRLACLIAVIVLIVLLSRSARDCRSATGAPDQSPAV